MEQNQPENSAENQFNKSEQRNDAPSLEPQEQLNSSNLIQRIEEEDQADSNYSDANEITDQSSQGEEDLTGFLERTLPEDDNSKTIDKDGPLTRNLLGDNPPGAERAAFEEGTGGDASAGQFKYNSENLVEGFRENLDKTEEQVNLDKKLRDQSGLAE